MPKSLDLLSRVRVRTIKKKKVLVVRDMRIRASDVLREFALQGSENRVLKAMPKLERADIRACISYACEMLESPPYPDPSEI